MAEPFMGELRMMSFPFAPKGWASADGQVLPITQNAALFSLLGHRYYRGTSQNTRFALPNLRMRVPIHVGPGYDLGSAGGESTHTLTTAEMPTHHHLFSASQSYGDVPVPTGNILARTDDRIYDTQHLGDHVPLNEKTLSSTGGGQAHENKQPYQNVNWCVALLGVVPPHA